MTKAFLTKRPNELFADPFFRNFFGDRDLVNFGSIGSQGNLGPITDSGRQGWIPSVDVRETNDEFVFTAELPGLDKNDVSITLEDNVLTLAGERSFEDEEKKDEFHRIERSYGRFTRSFTLPHEVDADNVAANYSDGILTVSIPKAEKIKPRKIDIS